MDRDVIRPNAAKQGLAKILFEFALGKIGGKAESNPEQAISDPHELYRELATPRVEVMD